MALIVWATAFAAVAGAILGWVKSSFRAGSGARQGPLRAIRPARDMTTSGGARMSLEGKSLGQAVAILVGLAYAVGGVIGFAITGFSGFFDSGDTHSLLGLILNPFQCLIHLAVGVILLWAATRDAAVTEGVMLGVGGVYVVATITGF